MLTRGAIALLLDCCAPTWTSREDFHGRLATALRQRGVSTVIALSGEPAPGVRQRFEAAGAEVVVLPYNRPSAGYARALSRLFREREVALVHARYFDYFSLVPWHAKLAGASKIIFTEANSGEWQPHLLTRGLVRSRARLTTAPVDRIIAISEFVRRRLVSLGICRDKTAVVYNGVDTDRYAPDPDARASARKAYGIADGEVVVSTMAVLRPWKHPEVLIGAIARLAAERVPVRLLFAGDGAMLPGLKRLAGELGIADRVIWLGHTSEPWNVFQASDIFAFASEGEAFGFVVAEALACGVPVVAARSGALPEVVEDGCSGLLAQTNDAADFAAKIRVLVEDEALRKQYACAAVRRAREMFGIDTAVANTLDVYDDIT
ncbi:MAG: glycosyltransferase family 4 protein [bacterium]